MCHLCACIIWTEECRCCVPRTGLIHDQIEYMSCKADPDLWFKADARPDNNFRYYAYILCHVDDILCVHHDPMTVLDKING
jgi:hypothetical protein